MKNTFYYMNLYGGHWKDISQMLDDNYDEYINDAVVIVGAFVRYSVEEFRTMVGNRRIIAYQLEPLVSSHWFSVDKIVNNLRGADEVWDYDLDNIKVLNAYGIDAKFRPCLYSKSLKRIENQQEPDIDILFYGTPSTKRTKLLHEFLYKSYMGDKRADIIVKASLITLTQVWGNQLDDFIGRSKIILNLNPYEGDCCQQQTRIFYALTNNKCVLSERCKKNYFGDLITEFDGYQDLYDKAADLLDNDNWRKYSNNNFEVHSSAIKSLLNK